MSRQWVVHLTQTSGKYAWAIESLKYPAKSWFSPEAWFQEPEIGQLDEIGYTVLCQSSTIADLVEPIHVVQYWIQGKSEKNECCDRTRQIRCWTESPLPFLLSITIE